MRIRAGESGREAEEYIPLFVRAARPSAPIAMLVPTASYLAYAHEHLAFDAPIDQAIVAHTPILSQMDVETDRNREFGLSTYDHHADGAGVCYSSYRRPIVNMRPKYRLAAMGFPWQFPADLSVVGWLEHMGCDYEAQYYSERMMVATENYLAEGGRFLYRSDNGYYWVTGFAADKPWLMEIRKLDSASRAWQARPGKHYLQTTGEKAGYGDTGVARRKNAWALDSPRRAWTSRNRSTECRTATTRRCPGSSRA